MGMWDGMGWDRRKFPPPVRKGSRAWCVPCATPSVVEIDCCGGVFHAALGLLVPCIALGCVVVCSAPPAGLNSQRLLFLDMNSTNGLFWAWYVNEASGTLETPAYSVLRTRYGSPP